MTDEEFDEVFMLANKMYEFVLNANKMRYNLKRSGESYLELQSKYSQVLLENAKLKGEIK